MRANWRHLPARRRAGYVARVTGTGRGVAGKLVRREKRGYVLMQEGTYLPRVNVWFISLSGMNMVMIGKLGFDINLSS